MANQTTKKINTVILGLIVTVICLVTSIFAGCSNNNSPNSGYNSNNNNESKSNAKSNQLSGRYYFDFSKYDAVAYIDLMKSFYDFEYDINEIYFEFIGDICKSYINGEPRIERKYAINGDHLILYNNMDGSILEGTAILDSSRKQITITEDDLTYVLIKK